VTESVNVSVVRLLFAAFKYSHWIQSSVSLIVSPVMVSWFMMWFVWSPCCYTHTHTR